MASTGEIVFTQASTTAEGAHADEAWVNPTNALQENDTYASVTAGTFDVNDQTQILRTYDASTALAAALPSDLVSIDGVIVRINGYSDSTTLVDFDLVQLLDDTGALSGTNLASPSVQMGTDTAAIHVFGTSTEKWGLGAALTRALLIDAQFGVGIGVLAQTNNSQCFVDVVTIEVFYTPAAATLFGTVVLPLTTALTTQGIKALRAFASAGFTFTFTSNGIVVEPRRGQVSWAAFEVPEAPATLFGQVVLPLTSSVVTNGVRGTFGQAALPLTASLTTSAKVVAKGQLTLPLVIAEVAAGKVDAKGQVVLPLSTTIFSDGDKPAAGEEFGQSIIDLTLGLTTQGQRTAHGSLVFPLSASIAAVGRVQARGSLILPLALSLTDAGKVEAKGATVLPLALSLTTNGTRYARGASVLPLTLALTTQGKVGAFGDVVLPLALDIFTRGTTGAEKFGTVIVPLALGLTSSGKVQARGQVSLPLALGLTSVGKVHSHGSVVLPLSLGLVDVGHVGLHGSVVLPLDLALQMLGRIGQHGSVDLPLVFDVLSDGHGAVILLDPVLGGIIAGVGTGGINGREQGQIADTVAGLIEEDVTV